MGTSGGWITQEKEAQPMVRHGLTRAEGYGLENLEEAAPNQPAIVRGTTKADEHGEFSNAPQSSCAAAVHSHETSAQRVSEMGSLRVVQPTVERTRTEDVRHATWRFDT